MHIYEVLYHLKCFGRYVLKYYAIPEESLVSKSTCWDIKYLTTLIELFIQAMCKGVVLLLATLSNKYYRIHNNIKHIIMHYNRVIEIPIPYYHSIQYHTIQYNTIQYNTK